MPIKSTITQQSFPFLIYSFNQVHIYHSLSLNVFQQWWYNDKMAMLNKMWTNDQGFPGFYRTQNPASSTHDFHFWRMFFNPYFHWDAQLLSEARTILKYKNTKSVNWTRYSLFTSTEQLMKVICIDNTVSFNTKLSMCVHVGPLNILLGFLFF